ncbi:dihydroxyacetone kinase family protein [Trebonia kvetii]|uniref:Dihydroxyacetone kinase family protein n=1 Tax=Trebonia kvetii TaxID=2480626 RepID=A0A6P2BMS7_9ACTN|nr:dihydroxyacetone kinase family protein [Trebonia kvetii]TVY98980.1 dihydroxyacetone kinase family protein [Trebonia kvetii]
MTYVCNAPAAFAAEMLEGFADVHKERVRATPGGVLRAVTPPAGKVAVVTGGGSGHYPAFAGLVGPGLADAAAVGDLFASPSARQIVDVARAADRGGGVLFVFGNYTGDVLNFTLAAQRLRLAGVDVAVVPVTDDVASASPDEAASRRGIAGSLIVYKVAGAAAEAGLPLDRVADLTRRANERTRSLGVAFTGCTLPGAAEPLFTVANGEMGVGLGIHGEPGIRTAPVPPADELARLLVGEILRERPPGAQSDVAVVLNGLGATKHEELFVLWRSVARLLTAAGLRPVRPEVGEQVTSLDMAGCSLSVCWLDDELARLWNAPADTPAFRRVDPPTAQPGQSGRPADQETVPVTPASIASKSAAAAIRDGFAAMAAALHTAEEALGRLDAIAGDGDHGRGMTRGCGAALAAAARAVEQGGGARTTLLAAASGWADAAGGTSGALWGAGLLACGACLDDATVPDGATLVRAVHAAAAAVQELGGANAGDKTMIDVLLPFRAQFTDSITAGARPSAALRQAAVVARDAAQATAALRPRRGRARPLAERSLGNPDPGAVSLALCIDAIATVLKENPC